jgi:hypothetical protein
MNLFLRQSVPYYRGNKERTAVRTDSLRQSVPYYLFLLESRNVTSDLEGRSSKERTAVRTDFVLINEV